MTSKPRSDNVVPRRPPEDHDIPGLGAAKIGRVSFGDAYRIADEAEKAKAGDPEEYANRVFAHIILEPDLSMDEVAKLDESAASKLTELAAERLALEEEIKRTSESVPARHRLYEAHARHDRKQTEQLLATLGPAIEAFQSQHAATMRMLAANFQVVKASLEAPLRAVVELPKFALPIVSPPRFELPAATVAQLAQINDSFKGISQSVVTAAELAQASKSLEAITQTVRAMPKMDIPTSVFDASLIRSGIDSPAIHTQTFLSRPPLLNREPTRAEIEKRRLVNAYDSLAKFEFEMREIITNRLNEAAGAAWWKQRIPGDVKNGCELRKVEKERAAGPSHPLLYYAYPDDYRKIITQGPNWDECFAEIFVDKHEVETLFGWIAKARPDVAHARPLGTTVYTKFMVGISFMIDAIEQWRANQRSLKH